MGANCCVSSREKDLPIRSGLEVSAHRNIRYSPSWNFRWDNRTHIEDIVDNPGWFPHGNSGSVCSEIKSVTDTETEGVSNRGSPLDSFQAPEWKKPAINEGSCGNSQVSNADVSTRSNSSAEEDHVTSSNISGSPDVKLSVTLTTPPFSSALKEQPSSSRSCSFPSDPTSLRKSRGSPVYRLSRQISDSRIPTLKSLNENSSGEGKQSFVLSVCSNDLPTGGSQGGSSDGWSLRTFSELVASSQRERWSFDSENLNSFHGNTTPSNSQQLVSPAPANLQKCGVCSKLLLERPWHGPDLSAVAVLVCGHVYHAECLENVTSEIEMYDPSCPVCANGGKYASNLSKKAESKSRNKISRIAVTDVDLDGDSAKEHWKSAVEKGPKMGASSSLKSSFSKPFLRRHFSIGSRHSPRPLSSQNDNTRKKGFWARYRKD